MVTCLDAADQPREFTMTRQRLLGEAVSIGANYPSQFVRFETRSIGDDVGYIKFNLFSFDVIGKFCDTLTQFKDKKAIVVDLRGNLGGLLATLIGVSGMFIDRPIDIGTMITIRSSEPLSISPKVKHFTGRVVFLVDNQSLSAAELFAAGLQENDRVLVVGVKTAGEALPASTVKLATGATFLYPVANFKTKKGNFLEGTGLVPNFTVALDRKSLLDGKDSQLERALSLIRENRDFPKAFDNTNVLPPPPIARPVPKTATPPNQQGLTVSSPPPPPKRLTVLGNADPPPAKLPDVKDERSLKVIAGFLTIVDAEAFKSIKSYDATGIGTLGVEGSKIPVKYQMWRQQPDKFAFTIITPTVGDIREIHNGKIGFVESDYGLNQVLPPALDAASAEIFSPISALMDLSKFNSLRYLGVFDRDGRKVHIIEGHVGTTPTAMAFDVLTKVLVSFASAGPPLAYGDYRKVGAVTLPFHINIEQSYDIELTEIKLNTPIDESNFKKKEKCFDKPL